MHEHLYISLSERTCFCKPKALRTKSNSVLIQISKILLTHKDDTNKVESDLSINGINQSMWMYRQIMISTQKTDCQLWTIRLACLKHYSLYLTSWVKTVWDMSHKFKIMLNSIIKKVQRAVPQNWYRCSEGCLNKTGTDV